MTATDPTRATAPAALPQGPLWTATTVGSLVLRTLRRYPERVAFASDTGRLTYAGALDLIGCLQRVLAAHGLRRGDRIGLLAGNSAEAWCAGMAVQLSGMATSFLHPLGSVEDQLYQLADLDAAACVVDALRHGDRGGALAERCGDVAVLGLGPSEFGPDLLAEAAAAGAGSPQDLARPEDIALVSYTGGTTGRPKGAMRRGILPSRTSCRSAPSWTSRSHSTPATSPPPRSRTPPAPRWCRCCSAAAPSTCRTASIPGGSWRPSSASGSQ